MTKSDKLVVFASSLGTVFEWYDFLLVGALAAEISRHFFSGVNPAAAFIFTLLSFAAGFAVRPLGAVVFGRLGDLVGRKYTFVITIVLMGFATFAIGLLPGFASIGIAAPVVFVALRMLQGLAIGGEYGGAVIYVAEHAPDGHRGSWTSWIQTTGSLALLMSLGVVLFVRYALGEAAFADWGWRIPFLLSIVLLLISVWIRLKLNESPAFLRMKAQGRTSKAPLSEAFGQWRNLKLILIAFFGLAMGQAVIWYTGQFYSLFFLTQILKTDSVTANWLIIIATLLTAPLYYVFGTLSDGSAASGSSSPAWGSALLSSFPCTRRLPITSTLLSSVLSRMRQSQWSPILANVRSSSIRSERRNFIRRATSPKAVCRRRV